jgi:hypothetical protein
MAAIHRHSVRQTLLQMQSLRVAAWGAAEDVEQFRAEISGESGPANDETDVALAAFGLSWAG